MSTGHKEEYAELLTQHTDMMQVQLDLVQIGQIMASDTAPNVAGSEDLQEQALQGLTSAGRGLFSVARWVGGKALNGFVTVITAAGNGLSNLFASNERLIGNVLSDVGKVDGKELAVPAKKIALITAKGDPDQIRHDLDTLITTLETFDKHSKDLLDHLDKELVTLKKLKSVKTSEQVHAIIDEFTGLHYPAMAFSNKSGDTVKSDVLPGGRVLVFTHKDGQVPTYGIAGEAAEGEGKTLTLSKSEISEILNKLQKVNALHERVKASYGNYLKFIKSWGDMVKGVDGNLSQADQVSKTVIGEAEKLMAGNMGALAFYSGFTPRVVGYADKYIHGVLGVFA